ncbi:MAG: autotransporter outer membrane beta-barrel domain-containing protein [Bdellovibrionales bacterium]|jgi:uncharacterized protein YhjY with autotransporter beta-barrel domain
MAHPRVSSLSVLAFLWALAPCTAQASTSLADYAQTPDQTTVGTVFDTYGSAAAGGSTLDTDYNRLFIGGGEAASLQSMLPTTAYNMQGVASGLAASTDSAITSRLRSLREGNRLATRRVAATRPAPFTDLQKSDEPLHDLRLKEPTPAATSTHGTTNHYRLYNPAVYQDPQPPKPASTWVERQYDEMMRKISIGAGAANATTRDTQGVRQRILLNQADRTGRDIVNWAGEVGGSGHTFDSAKGLYPRYTQPTLREKDKKAIANYPGQPLSNMVNYNVIPADSVAPAPQAAPVPPVIYGPDDDAPNKPVAKPEPAQSSSLFDFSSDNEAIAAPVSKTTSSTLRFRQTNHFAMVNDPVAKEANTVQKSQFVPLRATTDAGTYLWLSDDEDSHATLTPLTTTTKTDETPLLAQEPLEATPINADRRWGTFVSGQAGFGHDELQTDGAKAKSVRAGITAGMDYRVQDNSYVGLALTYAHSSLTTASLGDLQADSVALSAYGTTDYATNAYVDGFISVGYHSLDSQRTILAGNDTTRKATASPDGFQFTGKAETGYDFKHENLKYGPYAGLRLAYADFGSFTEDGAGNFNLKVKGTSDLSAIASLGMGGSMPYAMSNGGVFLPALRVGYNHELGDDQSTIKAEFANLAGSSFTTKGAKKSRDWVNVNPSLTAALANDWTFAAQYEHDFFRDDSSENIFNLAAHYKW